MRAALLALAALVALAAASPIAPRMRMTPIVKARPARPPRRPLIPPRSSTRAPCPLSPKPTLKLAVFAYALPQITPRRPRRPPVRPLSTRWHSLGSRRRRSTWRWRSSTSRSTTSSRACGTPRSRRPPSWLTPLPQGVVNTCEDLCGGINSTAISTICELGCTPPSSRPVSLTFAPQLRRHRPGRVREGAAARGHRPDSLLPAGRYVQGGGLHRPVCQHH